MRVGFDAHMVGERETGNETYALGLLHGLNQIRFPVDTYSFARLAPSIHRQHRVLPRTSILRVPFSSPLLALRDGLDLFHATYVLPPLLPCPSILTVHDITFALHPEWFPPQVRRMLALLVPASLRKAAHVIAISKQTKQDIVERYRLPPEKITVTYLAPRPSFSQPPRKKRQREPFFLHVGNVEPRKNVDTVIRAIAILHQRGLDVPLKIVGKRGLGSKLLDELLVQLAVHDLVQFTGYVPDTELRELYTRCQALLHPALYEGFGLTPLEAMAQGAPVVAARTSSIPEVVGNAAILLDPHDPEAWADSIERLVVDESLRAMVVEAGIERAKCFSWERCARDTVDVYRQVLDASHSIH